MSFIGLHNVAMINFIEIMLIVINTYIYIHIYIFGWEESRKPHEVKFVS